jgi:hypothetical protein
LKEKKKS